MRRLLPATMLALALLAVAALPASGGKRFCSGLKVAGSAGGVTVYKDGRTFGVCSNKLRKKLDIAILDPGEKVKKVVGAKGRCAAIYVEGGPEHAQIGFKDLKSKEIGTGFSVMGYGADAAKVASMAMASNCAMAWGESVTLGGVTTFRIRARGVSTASALPDNSVTEVATVESAKEIRGVKVKAAGKALKVTWPGGHATVPAT